MLNQRIEVVPVVNLFQKRLMNHWNKKLALSEINQYPLAPRDLVKMGLVNPENYKAENEKFGLFSDQILENEIERISLQDSFRVTSRPCIKILGLGLSRGLAWIEKALGLGFYVKAYDISSVSRDLFEDMIKDYKLYHRIDVINGEVEAELRKNNEDFCESPMYFLSQFIQVQKPTKMRRIMRLLGDLMTDDRSKVGSSIYIVHPFKKDNIGECEWNGLVFSGGVEWGDTTPYELEDLLLALNKKLRLRVAVDILGVHKYFHQTYSMIRISVSKG